jgi:polysaccharide export outer membrane protein
MKWDAKSMSLFKTLGLALAACTAMAVSSGAFAQPGAASAGVAPPVQPIPAAGAGPAAVAGAGQGAANQEYVLGPEDVVEIEVLGTNDKTRGRIYTDGTLQVNLVGKLMAAGRTPRELGADLAKLLKAGGYYADPVVSVDIVNFASRYVTVLGAVGSPGLVPINRPYRLSEILARVGGVREGAADYLVVRSETGPEKRYDVQKLASGAENEDPFVTAGDKIFSPPAEVFYISGQVHSPGTLAIKTGMTIGQAIARAGGLTDSGSDKHVKVKRGGKELKLESDAKVEPGDVLTISERLF